MQQQKAMSVIENLEPIPVKEWETKRPGKSQYASKRTIKVETEGAADIMKQEWIVTNCENKKNCRTITTISCVRNWPRKRCIARTVLCCMSYFMANFTVVL